MSAATPPPVRGVLETAVYVDDLARAHAFYGGVLGLERVLDTPRMLTYAVAPAQVLLVFRRGMTREDSETSGGMVPGHHSEGPAHFAFAIDAADYDAWKAHLRIAGVAILSEVTWSKGGKSLYFDDPDGNVLELATPGLWPNY
jgi:catechol 2,3-dioxygenase-like lactoylglutathione lyase family enzyme